MNHTAIAGLETWLSQQIIGQADLVKKLLIAILADGHLLVCLLYTSDAADDQ